METGSQTAFQSCHLFYSLHRLLQYRLKPQHYWCNNLGPYRFCIHIQIPVIEIIAGPVKFATHLLHVCIICNALGLKTVEDPCSKWKLMLLCICWMHKQARVSNASMFRISTSYSDYNVVVMNICWVHKQLIFILMQQYLLYKQGCQ